MHFKISTLLLGFAIAITGSAQAAEVGQAAPHCHLATLDGKSIHNLPQYRGKVVYVDFWASWCGPCAQSFPFMSKLHQDLSGRGLQVLGVNLDEDPEDAKSFLGAHPAQFTVVADSSGSCPNDFGVHAMPSTYVIDRKGVIRGVHLGFRPGEAEKTRQLIEKLLAEPAS